MWPMMYDGCAKPHTTWIRTLPNPLEILELVKLQPMFSSKGKTTWPSEHCPTKSTLYKRSIHAC